MTDLFGNEGRAPGASLRPLPKPVALNLFDAAAEHRAMRSGRPKSQERAELAGAGYVCICGRPMTRDKAAGRYVCEVCG